VKIMEEMNILGERFGENCGEIVVRMAIQLFSSNLHVIESDIYGVYDW